MPIYKLSINLPSGQINFGCFRFISVEESVRTLAQNMFDFSQLSRLVMVISRLVMVISRLVMVIRRLVMVISRLVMVIVRLVMSCPQHVCH